jgi:P27 family predicted phage terminase small subunit
MTAVRAAGGGKKSRDGNNLPALHEAERVTKIAAPDELRDDNAISIWETQSAILIQRGVLSMADAATLLIYCNSFSLYLEAEKKISKEGLTIATDNGSEKKHPAINARQDALTSFIRTGSLLGLDPLSRTKLLGGGAGTGSGENEFNEFT